MARPEETIIEGHRDESLVLEPGRLVLGKGIYIGKFDLLDAYGKALGIRTRWFDAAIALGIATNFNDTAKEVANNCMNGRGGLHLDPARYEADLFEKLKTGEAVGRNVIPPRRVVQTIFALRNMDEYRSMRVESSPGRLITQESRTDYSHWQWTCTPNPGYPYDVWAVDFTDGCGGWYHRDNNDRADSRLSTRLCFAELAL